VGCLLKDRVGHVADFVAALERVAAGGTALDPEVISQLLRRPAAALATLTPREREVLGLMAEGRSNSGIAAKLVLSEGAVESTSPASSASWASSPRRATTAGSWPCCATWAREVSARRRRS
jgi:FixJ family two-component response regulator